MNFIPWVTGAYLIALLPLTLFYKRLEPKWLRLFLWYILLEYAIQVAAYTYPIYFRGKSNHFIVNIHTIVEHVFYLSIFYLVFTRKILKKLTLVFALSFICVSLFEIIFQQHFLHFDKIVDNTGDVLVVIGSLLYMGELLVKNEVVNYFKVPMFWITTGILISFTGVLGYISFLDIIIKNHLDADGRFFFTLIIVINYIQYLLFAIGFSCNTPWKKTK